MSKTARNSIFIIILIVLVGIVGAAFHQHKKANQFVQSTTPTLFFHGGGSSYHAEEHMVNSAKKAGVTDTILRADVDKDGHVTLHGTMHKNSVNPIVEVNYEDNRQLDFTKHGVWATNVVKTLQDQYGVKNINMVGHSLGNISIIYYMLDNAKNQAMPKLRKQVDIAGHFDGLRYRSLPAEIQEPAGLKVARDGKPNRMNPTYQEMTKLRSIYPKNQVRVLNIIGDIGGHTDGTVTNASSLSLKYLLGNRAKSYQVKEFHGKRAQHSKLHSNPAVDKVLINFLWRK